MYIIATCTNRIDLSQPYNDKFKAYREWATMVLDKALIYRVLSEKAFYKAMNKINKAISASDSEKLKEIVEEALANSYSHSLYCQIFNGYSFSDGDYEAFVQIFEVRP